MEKLLKRKLLLSYPQAEVLIYQHSMRIGSSSV